LTNTIDRVLPNNCEEVETDILLMRENSTLDSSIKFINVFGFKVFSDDLDKIPIEEGQGCQVINTISPNSYGISTQDPEFRTALKNTDYLVLDGVYFALSSFFLLGKTIQKNQGPDVFRFFMQKMNERHGKIFFLGSSNDILKKIHMNAKNEFPNIQIQYFSPPYKPVFDKAENDEMIDAINSFSPDVLFIGMTAPKQEKWAYAHKDCIKSRLAVSIGAVFDWYAGTEKPIAPFWWKLRLGWLIRTIQRPEILKRYPNIFIFFRHLAMAIAGSKKYKYGRF